MDRQLIDMIENLPADVTVEQFLRQQCELQAKTIVDHNEKLISQFQAECDKVGFEKMSPKARSYAFQTIRALESK